MSLVHRIFFDTNALHQNWPVVSVKVENILAAARKLCIAVEMPEPVMMELERNWSERTKQKLQSTTSAMKELQAFVGEENTRLPDWHRFQDAYTRGVEGTLRQWNIEVTPMSSAALGDVFKHAVHKELLFGDEGRNFKDVVIVLSAVNRMKSRNGEIGVVITDDGVFHNREKELSAYCADFNVRLKFWKLEDTESNLSNMLEDAVKMRLQRHRELASSAIMAELPRIQQRFNVHLGHVAELTSSHGVIERDVNFDAVRDVDVPVLDREPQTDEEIRISAYLEGTVKVVRIRRDTNPIVEVPVGRRHKTAGVVILSKFDGNNYQLTDKMNFSF